ncbi:MAG: SnoaL-like domain-containing protein [Pseudomonadota bacterium]
MSTDTLKTVANTLADYCRTDKEEQGLSELYASDAVSVEATEGPSGDRVATGLEAIRGKHQWWADNFEVHAAGVDGPFLHGDDRFSLIFDIDATHKQSGQRQAMKEVAVYSLNDAGKIAREEFFYTM